MESFTDQIQRESDDDAYYANEVYLAQLEEEEKLKKINYDKRMEIERIDKINAINRLYGADEIPGGTIAKPAKLASNGKWDDRWWKRLFVSFVVASVLSSIFQSIFKSQTNTAIFFDSSIQLAVLIYCNIYKLTNRA